MQHTLNGTIYDDIGRQYSVVEGYVRRDHPSRAYRQDKRGDWRVYYATQRGTKWVYRSGGRQTPPFIAERK